MKTLAEHNKERIEIHLGYSFYDTNGPHPNGIACPECETELWDSSPAETLAIYPPQKNVHCEKCGYTGYRIA